MSPYGRRLLSTIRRHKDLDAHKATQHDMWRHNTTCGDARGRRRVSPSCVAVLSFVLCRAMSCTRHELCLALQHDIAMSCTRHEQSPIVASSCVAVWSPIRRRHNTRQEHKTPLWATFRCCALWCRLKGSGGSTGPQGVWRLDKTRRQDVLCCVASRALEAQRALKGSGGSTRREDKMSCVVYGRP